MVRKLTLSSLLALIRLSASISAAPMPANGVDPAIFAPAKGRFIRRVGNMFKRDKEMTTQQDGGIESLTIPLIDGVAGPVLQGVEGGVVGVAPGTQQTSDQVLGQAINELIGTLGGIAGNAEQGAGGAIYNLASAAQSTVSELQSNDGFAGAVVKAVGGE